MTEIFARATAFARRPQSAAALLVLFAVVVAYENILFRGQTLVASANAHPFDYREDRVRPTKVLESPAVNWHDLGATWWQWEPAARFFATAYHKGIVPLWDPTIAGGVDAHVNVTQGQYFPPYLLVMLSGDRPLIRDLYYLLLIAISGVACALLLVRNGFHTLSSAVFGVLYALSGSMSQTANSIIGQSFAVIPLFVLACDWLLERPTFRRTALFAIVIAVGVTASFLPAVISGLFLLPFLLIASVVSPIASHADQKAWQPIPMFTLGIALGLGSVAFILLPVHLASGRLPDFQTWYVGTGLLYYRWSTLLTLVSPRLTYDVWQQPNPLKHVFPHLGPEFFYVGLLPFLLLTFMRRPRNANEKRLLIFFLPATIVLLLKLLGVPPVQWIGRLPVLNTLHFTPYFCAALTFGIAGLAAMGVEAIIRNGPGRARYEAALVLTATFFLGLVVFASLAPRNASGDWSVNLIELARIFFLVFVFFRVISASLENRLTHVATGALVLGLVAFELATLAHRGRFRRADVWSNVPDYVAYLQHDRGLFRVHSNHALALTANVNQGVGLSGISSRHVFVPERFTELIRRYFTTPNLPYPVAESLLPNHRSVLDMLNIKYIIATAPREHAVLAANGLSDVFEDGTYHIFYNLSVWPRAYFTNRWRVARTPADALAAVGQLEKPDTVILEENPGIPVAGSPSSPSSASVRAVRYSYNFEEFSVRAGNPGLFVLLDNNSPGWRARVNGSPAEVLAANFAFRAVRIPAGQSTVVFEYVTPGLVRGLVISAMSVAAILVLALVGWRATDR